MACILAVMTGVRDEATRRELLHLARVEPFAYERAETWVEGPIGLCEVPLRSGRAGPGFAGAGAVKVAFDGRLDDRGLLVSELQGDARQDLHGVSDHQLVRLAWVRWGRGFVDHLLGDFALCLWDGTSGTLVCARDHFGVKPLYYATVGGALIVSNVLAAFRRSPHVSSTLCDRAVGDLLLFGDPQDEEDTLLADVRRVPPAHVLTAVSPRAPHAARYWRFDEPPMLRCHDPRDYVDRFRETLRAAVADRSAGESAVAVLMSGGLDSSSVAALAAASGPAGSAVRAYTAVYDSLLPDRERAWSTEAARALGIPIEHLPIDAHELFARWDGDARPVVPMMEPLTAVTVDLLARARRHSGVALTGDGGDPLLLPATVPRHLRRSSLRDLSRDLWWSVRRYRQVPLFGIRAGLRDVSTRHPDPPAWLAGDLLRDYDAPARWRERMPPRPAAEHLRGESMLDLRSQWWPATFESLDPGATRQPVELRYPFFDRRVVTLALSLPSYPWCIDKTILREAMRGRLPESIRLRPKTPLAGDPVLARRRWTLDDASRTLAAAPGIERFIDRAKFRACVREGGLLRDEEPGTLAAISLAVWLAHDGASENAGAGAGTGASVVR